MAGRLQIHRKESKRAKERESEWRKVCAHKAAVAGHCKKVLHSQGSEVLDGGAGRGGDLARGLYAIPGLSLRAGTAQKLLQPASESAACMAMG